MTDERRKELERLLAALEQAEEGDGLDAADHARLQELLADDALLDAALDQLEVDAMLRWHHGAVPAAARRAPSRRTGRLWLLPVLALAAALLIAAGAWFFARGGGGRTEPAVALSPSWSVEPTGTADYSVVSKGSIELRRGELRVRSVRDPADPLTISTPYGEARAIGTDFYIGAHTTASRPPERKNMMTKLTRILVLSGAVSLTTPFGALVAQSDELVVAPQGGPPARIVAGSSSDFGFDLYRELARRGGGDNLFFSPFSIASALAMTAEGARGTTAEEMGKVLRWPDGARRVGDDAQRLPFELARIHGGFAALNRLINAAETPEQRQLRQRVGDLTSKITAADERYQAARAARDRDAIRATRTELTALRRQLEAVAGDVKSYQLSVANALWGQKDFAFDPAFIKTIDANYDTGSFFPADFKANPAREVERINAWVAERTAGRIKDLASEPAINQLTVLALVNAIYFKARWLTPFDARSTRDGDFTTASGDKVKVPMMLNHDLGECRYGAFNADGSFFASPAMIDRGQREGLYPQAGGFQVLELPYQGRDLAMVLVLPDDGKGLARLEAQLSVAAVDGWLGKLEKRKTTVRMPRFEAETGYDLVDPLKAMGMVSAFNPGSGPNGADFSGMTTRRENQLYIGAAVHKAFVKVDEEGTEAAAATLIAIGRKGAPARAPFVPYFNAERPFVYMIRDLRTGAILFLGRVTNPKS